MNINPKGHFLYAGDFKVITFNNFIQRFGTLVCVNKRRRFQE